MDTTLFCHDNNVTTIFKIAGEKYSNEFMHIHLLNDNRIFKAHALARY